jgi:hypothetical protein
MMMMMMMLLKMNEEEEWVQNENPQRSNEQLKSW